MANIEPVITSQLEKIKPSNEEQIKIRRTAIIFSQDLRKKLLLKKISADVFIGGSLAKSTIVKKDKYDVDIFIRFSVAYKDKNLSDILGKVLPRNAIRLHGSRDYFQIIQDGIILEIVPVLRIDHPSEALNVTDLSYFHVNYVLSKIRANRNLADEIILTKAFCHANHCYGAESYIRGFSGYSIELLICHYKTFERFLEEVVRINEKEKMVIDDANYYKKNSVLKDLNESKLQSPIILVDPTFKQRNALAGLSPETFNNFKKVAIDFLKNPLPDFFIYKNLLEEFQKKNKNFETIGIKTNKQPGDISGTKSKKFCDFFISELKKEFEVLDSEFDYKEDSNLAFCYVSISKKNEEVIKGPPINDKKNYERFLRTNKGVFEKNKISYKRVRHDLSLKEFLKVFIKKDKKLMNDMSIKELRIVR